MTEIEYKACELENYPLDPADPSYASGRFLIEASAGTGKTYTIANLVRRLVEERNIPMNRLLVTTFSKAAAAELKDRIVLELNKALGKSRQMGDITRQLRLRMAISSIDSAVITTIHGFCFKMLKTFALETRMEPDTVLMTDDTSCRETLLYRFLRRYYEAGTPLDLSEVDVKEVIRHASPVLREIRPGVKGELCNILSAVQNGLQAEKERQKVITYDDMIFIFSKTLQEDPLLGQMVRSRFSAVFVDEFQDTSFDQFSIFDNCFPQEDRSVLFYMIGDPKQSIYHFRGADVHSYLAMKKTLPAGQIFSMKKNFRSSEAAIEAVNRIFAGEAELSRNAFLQENIDFIKIDCGKPGVFRMFENGCPVEAGMRIGDYRPNNSETEKRIYNDVSQEIASLLSKERRVTITAEDENGEIITRPLRASDIAVLIQKHDQAPHFIRRLARYGISASACRSGRVFQTAETEWLNALLQAWLSPSAAAVRQLMLSEFFDMECAAVAEGTGAEWISILRSQAEIWQQNGLPAAFAAFLDGMFDGAEETPREHILFSPDGERRMSNFQQLVELLHRKAEEENLAPGEIFTYLNGRCNGLDVGNIESSGSDENPEQLRLDRDAAAVQIVTMFASKGLEYPIVFVPFPAKTWGHHMLMKGAPIKIHTPEGDIFSYDAADKTPALEEALREQVRLLYVGLTRGKMMTYVCLRTAEPPNGNSTNFLRSAHGVMVSEPDPQQSPQQRLEMMLTRKTLTKPAKWFAELFPENGGEPAKKSGPLERFIPGAVGTLNREEPRSGELQAAEMPVIRNNWHSMSFSAYGYGGHSGGDTPADRSDTPIEVIQAENAVETEFFLSFPRGAVMGDFVHGILEKLARKEIGGCGFSAFQSEKSAELSKVRYILGNLLENNRLDKEIQLPRLMDGLRRALCTPLPGLDVPLCRIGNHVPEMEFFLKGRNLDLNGILTVMKEYGSEKVRTLLTDIPGKSGIKGVLNGLLDLIFEHEERYFIVDWKTNFLGGYFSDYTPEKVAHAMAKSGYILQYHLYSAALCCQLKQRFGAFDYSQFGGVYYLFNRGMGRGDDGIWFDRPPQECTGKLVKLFTGEEL
ncbi:MAG: UvrD-helicase domain-containing protein [Lentisphaeria bacterium]|nr:UvrD-helicase domain-containing protein [Lentisphaeria bacterium]